MEGRSIEFLYGTEGHLKKFWFVISLSFPSFLLTHDYQHYYITIIPQVFVFFVWCSQGFTIHGALWSLFMRVLRLCWDVTPPLGFFCVRGFNSLSPLLVRWWVGRVDTPWSPPWGCLWVLACPYTLCICPWLPLCDPPCGAKTTSVVPHGLCGWIPRLSLV